MSIFLLTFFIAPLVIGMTLSIFSHWLDERDKD
ncbi:type I toxin-antitoxin system Fst family toxin [Vagococcus coleopterorum]|uniref:Type I toxin-antitoxin system Fst family toxin n=1 Tax=Vagococcus coleopterorum TaxID=2714946 RepID=A0A6G8AP73_9ENTE|nr:type I toxin-antitoxin system Fst family toxin [Vagococcus coleopterorum]QIL46878.1 type I toxin-antitoxin system Fst family toxin [Vagococcus coleopterorum]